MTKQQEFNKKFVEPIDTEMRAMNLNNEPCVIGTSKEVWDWIEQKDKEQRDEIIKMIEGELDELMRNPSQDDVAIQALQTIINKLNI